jgi:hypothetical protein
MDEHFAQVSLLTCPVCTTLAQIFYDWSITASGRRYLGAITAERAAR